MADKVFKLSLEQLNDIVSDAVANAIKKLDGIEIVSDDQYIIAVGTWIDNNSEAIDLDHFAQYNV